MGKGQLSVMILVMFLAVLFFSGCAEIRPTDPIDAVGRPFVGGQEKGLIGYTKDELRAEWGEPDQIIEKGANELGAPKEEWIYRGRYRGVPLDVKYMSKTKHFIFEGNVLTKWSAE